MASSPGQRTLLYCGSLGPAHGPDFIVRLAERFLTQWPNIRILVVGDGSSRASLEEQARASGCLGRTILFLGNVARKDVPQYYASSDASIMTMAGCELLYRHSVQNKFFDSLAAGKAVFSNYNGWASELAEQEGAGLIVPRDDVAAAARVVATKIMDDDWLDRSGYAARRLAEERFGHDGLAARLEEVLVSAVGDGSGVAVERQASGRQVA